MFVAGQFASGEGDGGGGVGDIVGQAPADAAGVFVTFVVPGGQGTVIWWVDRSKGFIVQNKSCHFSGSFSSILLKRLER